jgi:hypothetical protein
MTIKTVKSIEYSRDYVNPYLFIYFNVEGSKNSIKLSFSEEQLDKLEGIIHTKRLRNIKIGDD